MIETISRIQKGDPFGVYKDDNPFSMFVRIAYNNISVAFKTVIFGVLFGVGTIIIDVDEWRDARMFSIYFFLPGPRLAICCGDLDSWHDRNFLHRDRELCRVYLGFGWLFPGTYTRKQSFLKSAKDAMKICISLIPFFIVAAFFESYITHLMSNTFQKNSTDIGLPVPVSIIILAGSFFLILWYFVLYPLRLHKAGFELQGGKILKNGVSV